MQNSVLLDLVHRLTDSDSRTRDLAAEEVTDVVRSLSQSEADLLVRTLVAARLVEQDETCQESQLNALTDLNAWHDIAQFSLAPLRDLDSASIPEPQLEYLEDLLGSTD